MFENRCPGTRECGSTQLHTKFSPSLEKSVSTQVLTCRIVVRNKFILCLIVSTLRDSLIPTTDSAERLVKEEKSFLDSHIAR